MVNESGGIDYAKKEMATYRDQALGILSNLPENDARLALGTLVNYVIDRKK